MDIYLHLKRERWQIGLATCSKFLLRWGWFVLASMILVTFCTSRLPDTIYPDTYQATLRVQVQLPAGSAGTVPTDATTAFLSGVITSPGTLNSAISKLNTLKQFHDLQPDGLQGKVTAAPVLGTNVVLLNAVSDTPQDATLVVTTVYQLLLEKIHADRSVVIDGLITALSAELRQAQADAASSAAMLQNLGSTGRAATFQYRMLSNLHTIQQKQADMINQQLITLEHQQVGGNDIFELGTNVPYITTIPGTQPTQDQRLLLSPLVGLIMGLAGAALANRFSTRLPLQGKKRELVLPQITAVFPALPNLSKNRLQLLQQASPQCLPMLRRLRYQASEYERRLQLITVTSPKGQEGKSTIATSLAIDAAQSGLRTLLVDANPRRPVLHTWFRLHNTRGMVDTIRSLALGRVDSSPLLNTPITGLSLLPIGSANQKEAPGNVQEELPIDGLRPLTELLSNQMDVIIFDGPPLLSDASAINLVALSDVVLLVIDAQTSRNPKVLEAQSLLANMGAPFATVFNRARPGYLE